jgi:peptidoglycan/xylan/chitin deacetylase (PgdA/CDA1 family)
MIVRVELPPGARCAVALSYDLEMCAGYSPVYINHGRIMSALRDYTLSLCEVASVHDVELQFFYVGNGLEEADIGYLEQIIAGGNSIDNHTYSHMPLTTADTTALADELELTNRRFRERLGVESAVLRAPGGYAGGLNLLEVNQRTILDAGFQWVSSHTDATMGKYGAAHDVAAASRLQPYVYPTGLIEIPFHGWMDRIFFDFEHCEDPDALESWRRVSGHRPVPEGWICPWTSDGILDAWIEFNLAAFDYVYDHGLLWTPVWHPYTHYLHDPQNRALPTLLNHIQNKSEPVAMLTMREAGAALTVEG